jgi:hypothetical protein
MTLVSSLSILRIEVIMLVFVALPLLKVSIVDLSFLRIRFHSSSGVESVLIESTVLEDGWETNNELDCPTVPEVRDC